MISNLFYKLLVTLFVLVLGITLVAGFSISQFHRPKQPITLFQKPALGSLRNSVIKEFSFSELEENSIRMHVYAENVVSRPVKWHLLKLMNYYELLLTNSVVEFYTSEIDRMEIIFQSIRSIFGNAQPYAEIFSESRVCSHLIFAPVEMKIYYPNGASLYIKATSATIYSMSQLMTLNGDIEVKSSYGERLNTREALWKFRDGILETVGAYAFLDQDDSSVGMNRQFLLKKGRIKKGIKGPFLALVKPQNPLLMMMSTLSSKAKKLGTSPLGLYFSDNFPGNDRRDTVNLPAAK